MAQFLDNFPLYDDIVQQGSNKMSDTWVSFMASFIQNLTGYLSQYGIFVPLLTTAERDEIQEPEIGQMIYNTDLHSVQTYNGEWGVFLPQMTATQITNIAAPRNGQLVYNTTTNKLQGRENGAWTNLI